MKKLILILLLALIPLSVYGGVPILGSRVASTECADSSCTGFLVCQNLEGTGYDNSETWSETIGTGGIVDEDDTTATILRGSQQLKIYAGNAGESSRSLVIHTAQNEVYGHFRFLTLDATPAALNLIWTSLDTAGNNAIQINLNTNGTLRMLHGTSIITTISTLSDSTLYHIWFHWLIGTGANGVFSIGFSTTTTEPTSGNNYAYNTNGTHTVQINRSARPIANNQATYYFDQILIKTTSIGDVCN